MHTEACGSAQEHMLAHVHHVGKCMGLEPGRAPRGGPRGCGKGPKGRCGSAPDSSQLTAECLQGRTGVQPRLRPTPSLLG